MQRALVTRKPRLCTSQPLTFCYHGSHPHRNAPQHANTAGILHVGVLEWGSSYHPAGLEASGLPRPSIVSPPKYRIAHLSVIHRVTVGRPQGAAVPQTYNPSYTHRTQRLISTFPFPVQRCSPCLRTAAKGYTFTRKGNLIYCFVIMQGNLLVSTGDSFR